MALDTSMLDADAGKALMALRNKKQSALEMFRPTVAQEKFFRAMAAGKPLEVAVTGRQRGGKSVACAIYSASVWLDEPVTMRNGEKLYMRPERWRGEAMLCWAIGYDWNHVGETLHRFFFQAKLFYVVFDKKLKQWRSYNPVNDKGKNLARKFAPPLIPEDAVVTDSMAWESKKDNQIRSVQLKKDQTRVVFYASTGALPTGNAVNFIFIDEKIESDLYYGDWLMRLVDYEGYIIWSCWQHLISGGVFTAIQDRALEQAERGEENPTALSFTFGKNDNPHTENATLEAALATMDDDERAARGEGMSSGQRWKMYARFSRVIHRAMGADPSGDDKLAAEIRKHNGIPPTFTRYLILDPGTANPAVLFVAVPPPELGDFIVPYDELYLHYAPARDQAQAIALKTAGQMFEEFIIDSRAARQTPMGFDKTIGENYEAAFMEYKLRSRRRGSMFGYGSDNPLTRILGLQGMMNIRQDGTTCLRILGCPILVKQLEAYKRAADPHGNPTDEPGKHQKIDVAVALEYLVSRADCRYVAPPIVKPEDKHTTFSKVVGFIGKNVFGTDPVPSNGSIHIGAGARS